MSKKSRHTDNSKRQQPTQRAQARQPVNTGPSKAGKEGKHKPGKAAEGEDPKMG
jgi:hypothetical protein